MVTLTCSICKQEYLVKHYRAKVSKYCSQKCYGISERGRIPKSAVKKGQHLSPKTEYKKGNISYSRLHPEIMHKGDTHYAWKGDKVGYFALHSWVRRTLGEPNICQHCNKIFPKNSRKLQWANKSGKYFRDLDDWLRLCVSCHISYDLNHQK